MTNPDKTIVVRLPLPPKDLSPNARVHWGRRHRHSKVYREAARAATLEATMDSSIGLDWSRAEVQTVFYHRDRRKRDQDNLIAMMKSAYDGIADLLSVDDVGWVHVRIERRIDKGDPRVEVTLTRVEDSG
jgi:crossover junction endodeoxyribonuclease RusA